MKEVKIAVVLKGLLPMLFDRYSGDNKTKLEWDKKIYTSQEDGKTLVMPAINLMSFLSAKYTESAPQRVIGRGWKTVAKAAQSFVSISPLEPILTRNGKPLTKDNAGLVHRFDVAKVVKGSNGVIPNPVERPQLNTPWELAFNISLLETTDLDESTLKKLFDKGGLMIGLGSWRGMFGKFEIAKWESK